MFQWNNYNWNAKFYNANNPLYSQEVDCALPPVFLCRIEDEALLVPRFATFNAIFRRRFCSLSVIFGASSFLDRHGRKRTGTIWKHICLLHFVLQKLISNHIISKTTLPSFSNRWKHEVHLVGQEDRHSTLRILRSWNGKYVMRYSKTI